MTGADPEPQQHEPQQHEPQQHEPQRDVRRICALTLLLLGAVPLAVTTWWSLATPLLAVLAILLGWPRSHRLVPLRIGA